MDACRVFVWGFSVFVYEWVFFVCSSFCRGVFFHQVDAFCFFCRGVVVLQSWCVCVCCAHVEVWLLLFYIRSRFVSFLFLLSRCVFSCVEVLFSSVKAKGKLANYVRNRGRNICASASASASACRCACRSVSASAFVCRSVGLCLCLSV